jgi:molecular chaperone GrpE
VSSTSSPDGPAEQPPAGDDGPPLDAASAAGFGGIAWADDQIDERQEGPAGGEAASKPPPPAGTGDDPPPEDEATDRDAGGPAAGPADDPGEAGETADGERAAGDELSVEGLLEDLERTTKERDQYLDASRRLQADFENYRKAVAKREIDSRQRANESLVVALLPVLDACDGALASGATDIEPIRNTLLDVLGKQGLDRIEDADKPFDPVLHDAVMHEPGEDGDGPVVAEVMRAGYSWKGRVVRPAMVRVRG